MKLMSHDIAFNEPFFFVDAWLGMGLVVVGVAICVGGK